MKQPFRNAFRRAALAAALSSLAWMAGAQTIEISGSTVVVKDMVQAAAPAIREATGVEIKTVAMGTGRGMVALFEGKTGMAGISESLEEATASARKTMAETGSKAAVPTNLVFHEIGRDRVAVFMHKDNPVKALNKAQVRDVFTGKVRNWKEVGGPDLPVKVYLSSPGSGTRSVFQKLGLDGADFAADASEFRTSVGALVEVAKDKGGISMAGPTLLDDAKSPNLRIISTPPVERVLGLVTVGKPSDAAQKVIDHLHKKK